MMKRSTKILSTLVATTVLSTSLIAGLSYADSGDKYKKRGYNIERMAERLELSEAQTVSFTEIMQVQMEKRRALSSELREEKREQMQAHREDTINSLSSVLDENQLAQLEEMMSKGKKRKHGKNHEGDYKKDVNAES